jgi:hypothetical protein
LVRGLPFKGISIAKINIAMPPNNGENGKLSENSITLTISENKAHLNFTIKCLYLYKYIPESIKYPPLNFCCTAC